MWRAYHARLGTTDAHPPCVTRALSGIGIALLLLPVLSFEAVYRYGLRGVELELPVTEPAPAVLQDALWIAHGDA